MIPRINLWKGYILATLDEIEHTVEINFAYFM